MTTKHKHIAEGLTIQELHDAESLVSIADKVEVRFYTNSTQHTIDLIQNGLVDNGISVLTPVTQSNGIVYVSFQKVNDGDVTKAGNVVYPLLTEMSGWQMFGESGWIMIGVALAAIVSFVLVSHALKEAKSR